MKKETLDEYEIGNLVDLDFLAIFEILKKIKNKRKKYSPKRNFKNLLLIHFLLHYALMQ